MSLLSIEDLLGPNITATAAKVRQQIPGILEVYYRLSDFGDHQRVEVLVVVADDAAVNRHFRHLLTAAFANIVSGETLPFQFVNLPPWALLRVVRASERDEVFQAGPWRTTTTS